MLNVGRIHGGSSKQGRLADARLRRGARGRRSCPRRVAATMLVDLRQFLVSSHQRDRRTPTSHDSPLSRRLATSIES